MRLLFFAGFGKLKVFQNENTEEIKELIRKLSEIYLRMTVVKKFDFFFQFRQFNVNVLKQQIFAITFFICLILFFGNDFVKKKMLLLTILIGYL